MKSSRKFKKAQPVRRYDGRIVGQIVGNTLTKNVKSSRHMLRSPRGWTWDKEILMEAIQTGVKEIRIIDDETGCIYTVAISDFESYGVDVDRGYGLQVCLPINYWQVDRSDKPPVIQLSLFDG